MSRSSPTTGPDPRSLALFLGLLAVAAGVATVALILVPRTSPAIAIVPYAYMLTPALAASLTRLIRREGHADAGLRWGRSGRWYALAWVLPVGMMTCVFLVSAAVGQASVSLSLERLASLNPMPGSEAVQPPPGLGETPFLLLLSVANVTFMIVPGMLLGLGEELGWRSWLLPRTLSLGLWPALALTGALWWLWHLPLGLLQEPPVPPVLAYPLGLAAAVAFGVVLAWIRFASGSIFPVALCHIASNQSAAALVILYDIAPTAQLVGLAAVSITVAAWVVGSGRLRRAARNAAATSAP